MALLQCMKCKHGSPDPKEVPAAAIGRSTQGSVGSIGDGCTGKGGNETWRIPLLQSQRSSRHYIGGYNYAWQGSVSAAARFFLEEVSRSVDVIVNIALMTS